MLPSVTDTFDNDKRGLLCDTHDAVLILIQEPEKTRGRGEGVSVGDRWAVGESALMSGICL